MPLPNESRTNDIDVAYDCNVPLTAVRKFGAHKAGAGLPLRLSNRQKVVRRDERRRLFRLAVDYMTAHDRIVLAQF